MLQHSIIIEFAQILHFCDTALKESEIVLFQSEAYRLNNIVDNFNHKFWVITIHGAEENAQEVNISIFNLPRLGKDLFENRYNLMNLNQ